jgi:DNA ligase 1
MSFQPMLADKAPAVLKFPLLVSSKLDGIRCTVINGVGMSRSFKPIPNRFVQKCLAEGFDGLDGELIVGDVGDPLVYNKTNSAVMSRDGEPEFTFWVFDDIYASGKPFKERYDALAGRLTPIPPPGILLAHNLVHNQEELDLYESKALAAGLEGLIARDPNGPYKNGRSTSKQGWMLKIKRFLDSEAEIIGFEEEMENTNEATKDAFGRTERSSHQDNMKPKGTLGAFITKDIVTGVIFNIGTGLTAAMRRDYWKAKNSLVGKLVKYKYFPVGVKDAPRHPVFIGFRDRIDL